MRTACGYLYNLTKQFTRNEGLLWPYLMNASTQSETSYISLGLSNSVSILQCLFAVSDDLKSITNAVDECNFEILADSTSLNRGIRPLYD